MQDKMKKLLEQIGMSSQYLENAIIEKIVVYDKTNLWEFIINNDNVLPVYIYDELCNKLQNTFKSINNIIVTINCSNNSIEYLEDYFDKLINNLVNESVKYKTFEGRDLKLEDGKYTFDTYNFRRDSYER